VKKGFPDAKASTINTLRNDTLAVIEIAKANSLWAG
jgi:hypothetical protein